MPDREAAPLLAIVGPTAVGKTALSLALAQQLGGEIVSADSRQVYRYMDIGTAKPAPEELAAAPHHLINVVAPDEEFSLALYLQQARQSIAAIHQRGRLPLLVGGSGQYAAALLEGWQVPHVPPQPELRAALEREAEQQGAQHLYQRLRSLDPEAAALIQPANVRRIIRALEVYQVTGELFSAQRARRPPPWNIATLWLELPREALYARIDARVEAMLSAGLLGEVRSLVEWGYGWALPAMSSLGYREFRPYFEGRATLEECVQRLKFNTHAFARRQSSWFRRLPNVQRLQAGTETTAQALQIVRRVLLTG